jgi:RimJ/RimL family protein N-acetyltransferase
MPCPTQLQTPRLTLRHWRESDRDAFAELNADPEVMEFFPSTLTRGQSDALVDQIIEAFARHGCDLWAVEITETGEFIGWVGLHQVPEVMPFAPGVEIGWRLARRFWGQGYATEAARACLRHGFVDHELREIVSLTAVVNTRSQRVMERLGMTRNPADDFRNPRVPRGHRLEQHVLYRISSPETAARASGQTDEEAGLLRSLSSLTRG